MRRRHDQNHDPDRPRKLLLHRREIERLIGKTAERGLTLVPTRIYFKGNLAKVELALARGKEGRDRRRDIAERDMRPRGGAGLQAAAELTASPQTRPVYDPPGMQANASAGRTPVACNICPQ